MLRLVLLLCLGTVVVQGRPSTTGHCRCENLERRIDDILKRINVQQGDCPNGWQAFGGSCYKVSGKAISWASARADCRGQHADLVTISSAEENALVLKLLREQSPSTKQAWIGFYRTKVDVPFAWVDDSTSSYTNWAPGEPNLPKTELCVFTYTASNRTDRAPGTWNNSICGGRKKWPAGHVCELHPTK